MKDDDKPKKKVGRKRFEPTEYQRKQVTTMAGYGMIPDQIAKVIGISAPTLRLHFDSELEDGLAKATFNMTQTLYQQATNKDKPNVVAAIFWLKARAGWRDADPREGVGKKEQRQQDAAEVASSSRFGVQPPPLKVVK